MTLKFLSVVKKTPVTSKIEKRISSIRIKLKILHLYHNRLMIFYFSRAPDQSLLGVHASVSKTLWNCQWLYDLPVKMRHFFHIYLLTKCKHALYSAYQNEAYG